MRLQARRPRGRPAASVADRLAVLLVAVLRVAQVDGTMPPAFEALMGPADW